MGTAHLDTVAAKTRHGSPGQKYELLTPFNQKSPKGEKRGYLQAMMYLAPATLAGGKTLCGHSTPACREGCLFTAGRGRTPRVRDARIGRTWLYLHDREEFMWTLVEELHRLQQLAREHGLKLAVRLNGTSDVLWERELINGLSLFTLFSDATFFDYTRTPPEHRKVPANWHLTFSQADNSAQWVYAMLRRGYSVAAVVPTEDRMVAPDWLHLGGRTVYVVDGEEDDLRFLDPPGALVLIRPKGKLAQAPSPMVHPGLIADLQRIEGTS